MNIFDDTTHEILIKFLDKKVKDAEEEIASKGTLSEEYAIPLLLKSQFNHIMHLDAELTNLRQVMDNRFKQVDMRFSKLEERLDKLSARFGIGVTLGFTIVGFLIILFGFLK